MPKAVVILPTYNERENIVPMLELLENVCEQIRGYSFSILVVDDSSPDGTADAAVEYQKTHKNVYVTSGPKHGLGKALLRGMRYAIDSLHADVIAQMDADLSHDPKALPAFFEKLNKGADFVVGSRYIPGGSIPKNWAPHRKVYSVIGNSIVRFGLGLPAVHDWTGGYRLYVPKYVRILERELEQYSGYVFQIAFLHKSVLLGAHVGEVPIHFTDRRFGHSKIAPSEYIKNVLLYVGRERTRAILTGSFGKFLVVGTIGFIVNTVILELFVAIGFHPVVGSVVGAETSIVSNFFLNNAWTFRSRSIGGARLWGKFFQFNWTSLGAIAILAGTVALGTYLYGVSTYRIFYVLGTILGIAWNYTMYSNVIWKK
ncbi:glycosyltransferase family 2 protein [Candidatus Gottesmanbacteria bacterium]|nr:glycosyltransferase family 2 protein [Candidatus Gottesmanbacteria bacterium]